MATRGRARSAAMAIPRENAPKVERGAREVAKEETWRRIRNAAAVVFTKDGYRNASIRSIAERAGVGKASVYRHVESKSDLYFAVVAMQMEDFQQGFFIAIGRGGTARERLEALAEWYVDLFNESDTLLIGWRLDHPDLLDSAALESTEAFRRGARPLLESLADLIREGIEAGEFVECDPWVIANLLWRMGDAFVEIQSSSPRRALLARPMATAFREGFGVILRGLSRE